MLSINFKFVLPVLIAATVVKEATATSLLKPIKSDYNSLYVDGSEDDCNVVAAELNDVSYGTKSVNKIGCDDRDSDRVSTWDITRLYVEGSEVDCKAVAAELNDVSYGTKSVNKIGCRDASDGRYRLMGTDEDANVLNAALYEKANSKADLSNTATATDLAEVKASVANTATAADLAEVKTSVANEVAELKADVAELKALLTPECTANRLARAQGLGTVPGAGPSNANTPAGPGKKVSAAAIAVPTVLVLVLAAVGVTVAVMKSRGAGGNENAAAHLRPPAAQPSTDQTNPAFTPADAAAVSIPGPVYGADEDLTSSLEL